MARNARIMKNAPHIYIYSTFIASYNFQCNTEEKSKKQNKNQNQTNNLKNHNYSSNYKFAICWLRCGLHIERLFKRGAVFELGRSSERTLPSHIQLKEEFYEKTSCNFAVGSYAFSNISDGSLSTTGCHNN